MNSLPFQKPEAWQGSSFGQSLPVYSVYAITESATAPSFIRRVHVVYEVCQWCNFYETSEIRLKTQREQAVYVLFTNENICRCIYNLLIVFTFADVFKFIN